MTTLAKAGDTVTVAFTSTDPNTAVTIGGHTATVTHGDGTNYTASYTVQSSDTGSTNVSVTSTDAAGNSTTQTATGTVTVDTTAPTPTITVNAITADNTLNIAESAGNVDVTGAVTNAQAGDAVTLTVGTHTYTGAVGTDMTYNIAVPGTVLDGSTTVHASVTTTDAAGNAGTGSADHAYAVNITAPTGGTDDREHASQASSEKGDSGSSGSGETTHASSGESEGAGQASGDKGDSGHDSFTLDHDSGIHIETESHPTVAAHGEDSSAKTGKGEALDIHDVLSGVRSGHDTSEKELVFEKAEAKDDSKTSTVKVSVSESGGDHSEHSTTPVPVYVSTNSHSEAVDNLLNHNQVKHD